MKVVLATPLFPPDIAEPAPYSKEIAARLVVAGHAITIVTYSQIPENIPGVSFMTVSKRQSLPIRLIKYTYALWKASRHADLIYAQNGASVELPAGLVNLVTGIPFVIRIGDTVSHARAEKKPIFRMIERFARGRAEHIVHDDPLPKPEWLPFASIAPDAQIAYETSWGTHLKKLEEIFTHV